jgi:hypothetical protein
VHIFTLGRDRSVTAARLQRLRYGRDGCSASSSTAGKAANISDSQAWTTSTAASFSTTVMVCSKPWDTSVASRSWIRIGDGDPGSTQARMRRSPVRVLVTANRGPAAMTAALQPVQTVDQLTQLGSGLKAKFGA